MATYSSNQYPSNSSDALFRAWGSAFAAGLAAVGLVQTADVGQIDWGTALAPVAPDTVQGYEIWRFADALQASAPAFIKFEYGSGGATNYPAIWVTVGDGSDGAGNLTGATSTRQRCSCNNSTAVVLKPMRMSGDTNRLQAHLFYDATGVTFTLFVAIERTKNSTGADTDDGILINTNAIGGGAGQWRQQYLQLGIGPTTQESRWGVLAPSFGTGSAGGNFAVYPVFLSAGVYLNPPLGVIGAFNGDVVTGNTISLNVYGASHTYFCCGTSTGATAQAVQAGTVANAVGVLMRYE